MSGYPAESEYALNEGPFGTYECLLTPAPPSNASGLPIGSAITSIDYTGPPNGVPPAFDSLVVDKDGRVWAYFAGQWN